MIDNKTVVEVINRRSKSYVVTLRNGERYEWLPASDGFEDVVEMPFRDVQWLHSVSATFKDGYLYLNNDEARKRLGLESETAKASQLSREEIEKALKGNLPQIKKAFGEISNREILREIVHVAKELGIDNVNKLQYLSELSGIPMEVLADKEEDSR